MDHKRFHNFNPLFLHCMIHIKPAINLKESFPRSAAALGGWEEERKKSTREPRAIFDEYLDRY